MTTTECRVSVICGRLQVTKPLEPGEKRQVQSFDVRLSTLSEATIDILFSKNKVSFSSVNVALNICRAE